MVLDSFGSSSGTRWIVEFKDPTTGTGAQGEWATSFQVAEENRRGLAPGKIELYRRLPSGQTFEGLTRDMCVDPNPGRDHPCIQMFNDERVSGRGIGMDCIHIVVPVQDLAEFRRRMMALAVSSTS